MGIGRGLTDGEGAAGRRGMNEGQIFLSRGNVTSFPAVERFRMLRAKIERRNLSSKGAYRLIAVTSAVPEEGKSLVAVNLARALSLDPQGKTLIVDCDLRRPTVHSFFGLQRRPGLTDAVYRGVPWDSISNTVAPGVDVITAGSELIDPTQAVERPELPEIFAQMKARYRYVIVDCPPVLLCPEPIPLSLIVDTTVLVVRAWRTDKKLVKDAVEMLGKQKILGVVFNEGEDAAKRYLDYGYYSYRRTGELEP